MTRTITWERNGQTEQQIERKARYGWTGVSEEQRRIEQGWQAVEIEIEGGAE